LDFVAADLDFVAGAFDFVAPSFEIVARLGSNRRYRSVRA
jgi:hypothetical protein